MKRRLVRTQVRRREDILLATRRAREISDRLGFGRYARTRLATAVSEIARQARHGSRPGEVVFLLESETATEGARLVVRITDRTRSAPDARERESLDTVRRLLERFESRTLAEEEGAVETTFSLPLPDGAGMPDAEASNALLDALALTTSPDPEEELVRRNAELLASLERAEAAVTVREEILGVVSHDLRSPLGAIWSSAEAIEELPLAGEAGEFAHEMAANIRLSAERMNALVADLLDLSLLQSGRLAVEIAPRDTRAILEDCRRDQAALAAERGVELRVEPVPPEAESVLGDRNRLVQILANLVGNALKFTAAGGRVTLSAARSGGEFVFGVRDTGRGIAAEELPYIFERLWQGESGRDGIGLGLSIVSGLVEAHGGRIDVESEPGEGTLFRVRLPARAGQGAIADTGR